MNSRPAIIHTKLVSFSGIDGAGKSTQINALCATLRQAGMKVSVVTFWDDIAQLTSLREHTGHKIFKGDKGVGSPDAPINRRDKNVRSRPMSCLRLFLYFVDGLSVRRIVKKALASDDDVVIFDRYIYDELANLTLANPLMRYYVRLMMKIVPRPHISYLLDADPVKARSRKPEYPLEFLYMSRQSYIDLSRLVGGVTIIPPMPVEDVKREIRTHTLKQFSRIQQNHASRWRVQRSATGPGRECAPNQLIQTCLKFQLQPAPFSKRLVPLPSVDNQVVKVYGGRTARSKAIYLKVGKQGRTPPQRE